MFVSRQGLREGAVTEAYTSLLGAGVDGEALLAATLAHPALRGRTAIVSSFGAESVLLLAMVAAVDPATPVLFLETDRHFPETLAYRDTVATHLGLTDVRDLRPEAGEAAELDPTGELHAFDPDACCALRKVRPLERALAGFDAWVTGRKRHQAATRAALPLVELAGGRLKLNPLAGWDGAAIAAAIAARDLPRHPLLARGYRSIGCATCTRAVGADEDARAGRWAGLGKTECGIHRP